MFLDYHISQASGLLESYRQKGLKLATAESCTGGLISALLTEIAGSSDVFECGFVTYSNESKIKLLGVDKKLIEQHGAVSEEVARAMAVGAIAKTGADVAVSVTGIAGPTGGTSDKPVGLVYIAVATKDKISCAKNIFTGNREHIRSQSVSKALEMLNQNSILTLLY